MLNFEYVQFNRPIGQVGLKNDMLEMKEDELSKRK